MSGTEGQHASFLDTLRQGGAAGGAAPKDFWNILVVDDDEEVHAVTKLVLKNFSFDGKGVSIVSAFSAKEAEALMRDRPDTALILLDVVMEHENAGLDFVRFVRDGLGNKRSRIILRTGYPGHAPEQEVIIDYDINDYKDKTELTSQKLRTAVVAALRSYRDISVIDANRNGLQQIIESLASIFKMRSLSRLASGVLTQLSALLGMRPDSLCVQSGMTIAKDAEKSIKVVAATGDYERYLDREGEEALPSEAATDIREAFSERRTIKYPDRLVTYASSESGSEYAIYLSGVHTLTDMELSLVGIFNLNASIAFDNQHLNEELEDTQREIIVTLGEVAEKRSRETGSHVRRVAEYCQLLGRLYGLREDEITLLGYAAPTHDIGKIGIPDGILNKPSALSPEELAVMRTHPELGYAMLGKSNRPILKASALIAKTHHENWDGSGYPAGLAGEAIPAFGRLVALADVFDALSHDRVYKKAWPLAEVVEYIRAQRGRQFEPALVDIFLANLDEFAEIRSRFPD